MPLSAFTFATAGQIRFGRGAAAAAMPDLAALAPSVLLVCGAHPDRVGWARDALQAAGARVTVFATPQEPDIALIEAGVRAARTAGAGAVVGLGGGAVLDTAKALAALVPATRPLQDHLEVVGDGAPLDQPALPCAALPTTAGTGAEVTRNAVIAVPQARRKVSLRDARLLPRLAVVDPALTDSCPPAVTLSSGLDAVTQVIEPYLSARANPLTDALCAPAIPQGLAALARLMAAPDNRDARDAMAWTGLCGGLALANAGLGVVHGLAGPLGGLTGAAHGALCGALLPHGLAANAAAGRDDAALTARLDAVRGWIADALGGPRADAFATLAGWTRMQGLPGLAAQGVDPDARAAAAEMAATASSMKANPVTLSHAALARLLEAATPA